MTAIIVFTFVASTLASDDYEPTAGLSPGAAIRGLVPSPTSSASAGDHEPTAGLQASSIATFGGPKDAFDKATGVVADAVMDPSFQDRVTLGLNMAGAFFELAGAGGAAGTSVVLDAAKGVPDVFDSFVDPATTNFLAPVHAQNRRAIEANRQQIAEMKARVQSAIALNNLSSQFDFPVVQEAGRGRRGRNPNLNINQPGGPGTGTVSQGGGNGPGGPGRAGAERSMARQAHEWADRTGTPADNNSGPGSSPTPTNSTARLDPGSRGPGSRPGAPHPGSIDLHAAIEGGPARGNLNPPPGKNATYTEYRDAKGNLIGVTYQEWDDRGNARGFSVKTTPPNGTNGKNGRAPGSQMGSSKANGGQGPGGQKPGGSSSPAGTGTGTGTGTSRSSPSEKNTRR